MRTIFHCGHRVCRSNVLPLNYFQPNASIYRYLYLCCCMCNSSRTCVQPHYGRPLRCIQAVNSKMTCLQDSEFQQLSDVRKSIKRTKGNLEVSSRRTCAAVLQRTWNSVEVYSGTFTMVGRFLGTAHTHSQENATKSFEDNFPELHWIADRIARRWITGELAPIDNNINSAGRATAYTSSFSDRSKANLHSSWQYCGEGVKLYKGLTKETLEMTTSLSWCLLGAMAQRIYSAANISSLRQWHFLQWSKSGRRSYYRQKNSKTFVGPGCNWRDVSWSW